MTTEQVGAVLAAVGAAMAVAAVIWTVFVDAEPATGVAGLAAAAVFSAVALAASLAVAAAVRRDDSEWHRPALFGAVACTIAAGQLLFAPAGGVGGRILVAGAACAGLGGVALVAAGVTGDGTV